YQQRVGIAQAIVNDPQILILDEPTNGLDPVQIQRVRELIKNLEEERTVIISTHILSEIEQIAERVLIIKDGAIVADDTLSNLLCDEQGWRQSLEEVFLRLNQ
ncbi:MAG: AAA family ATPase, partial [Candidatus Omnitrophica bacterium]|nr:AAA family ATPase [Candidatus Omnitrophota bacterium]